MRPVDKRAPSLFQASSPFRALTIECIVLGLLLTELLLQADRLLNSLVDEETGIRGYLATGNSSFLEPYQDTAAHLHSNIDTLASNAGNDPALLTQIAGIRSDPPAPSDVLSDELERFTPDPIYEASVLAVLE